VGIDQDELASPTVAELYYRQGDIDRAIRVMKESLVAHPENLKSRERLAEMEKALFLKEDLESRGKRILKLQQVLDLVGKEKG
jgi:hypothetical protein